MLKQGDNLAGKQFLMDSVQQRQTKAGKPFLTFKLRDIDGSATNGVMWSLPPNIGSIKDGCIVALQGAVDAYNGDLQAKVEDIVVVPTGDPMKYAKRSKFDTEKMLGDIIDTISQFSEPLTKFVANRLLCANNAVRDAFLNAPAAKIVHNNWYGGLCEHVWSLTRLASPIIDHYMKNYETENFKISKDKVMFGLIFHDLGKIVEYDTKTPAFNVSTLGTLTNHLVLGPCWVYAACNEFKNSPDHYMPEDQFQLEQAQLIHVLAAHHGTLEWGSPVVPSTTEALLVHLLDVLDSRMLHVWELLNRNEKGTTEDMSPKSFIERTSYLKHKEWANVEDIFS